MSKIERSLINLPIINIIELLNVCQITVIAGVEPQVQFWLPLVRVDSTLCLIFLINEWLLNKPLIIFYNIAVSKELGCHVITYNWRAILTDNVCLYLFINFLNSHGSRLALFFKSISERPEHSRVLILGNANLDGDIH